MTIHADATRLRLASARRRLESFLAQIDFLTESSFPHGDGKLALGSIKAYFENQRADLDHPPGSDPAIIDRVCHRLSDRISSYTAVLGLILRSTNVRNAFETHYVLKRLIERLFDGETRLVISSEWAFVPFTYPMNLKLLPNFVFIGSPAPEAGNPLLISLAGHEIGHSAWRTRRMASVYGPRAIEAVREQLSTNERAAKKLIDHQPLKGLELPRLENRCSEPVLEQLEEVYCDLFGLHLFGAAFLYAFDYLLGPGSTNRAPSYPSDGQRVAFLGEAAAALGIEVDPVLMERWQPAQPGSEEQSLFEIVDGAVASIVPALREDVRKAFEERKVGPPRAEVIEEVRRSFAMGKPYAERAELGEIVTAGWRRLFEMPDHEDEQRRMQAERVLADLVLKTIEVAEYHDRLADAER